MNQIRESVKREEEKLDEAKNAKQAYVTMKILLVGLQIVSSVGFNLGVEFPPMVTSKKCVIKVSLTLCFEQSRSIFRGNRKLHTKYGF